MAKTAKKITKGAGYSVEDRKSMKTLIDKTIDPYSGDVTGGSSVTVVKKKAAKKMASGGVVRGAGAATRGKKFSRA